MRLFRVMSSISDIFAELWCEGKVGAAQCAARCEAHQGGRAAKRNDPLRPSSVATISELVAGLR